jgi:hypothetical protein
VSLTANPVLGYDISRLPPYLGVKDDRSLTTGPDSKFIAQMILNVRNPQGLPKFDFAPIVKYGEIERQLDGLLRAEEHDDFGLVRPSLSAVHRVLRLLLRIAASGYVIQSPEDVGTDHDGNVRISWRVGRRFLELVAPFADEENPYIYHSEDSSFNVEPANTELLRNWLTWAQ